MKRELAPDAVTAAPLVIFGTGGSGTRIVVRIAREAGYWMGDHVNESEDALHVAAFLERAVNPYVRRTDWLNRVLSGDGSPTDDAGFAAPLIAAVDRHRATLPPDIARWGWKNPRGVFILPLLLHAFPRMTAIHVVRDGRDMAYSDNQNQLDKHGALLSMIGVEVDQPRHERSIALWSWLNGAAAAFGSARLDGRYLRVRFEDLCDQPRSTVGRIFEFLRSKRPIGDAVAQVRRPDSLGRWRRYAPGQVGALDAIAAQALAEMGYPVGEAEGSNP